MQRIKLLASVATGLLLGIGAAAQAHQNTPTEDFVGQAGVPTADAGTANTRHDVIQVADSDDDGWFGDGESGSSSNSSSNSNSNSSSNSNSNSSSNSNSNSSSNSNSNSSDDSGDDND